MKTTDYLLISRAPAATILIRLMVGGIFLSEGIQKFLFPEAVGADFSMLLGSIFLLLVGAGPWSLDALLARSGIRPRREVPDSP